MCYLNDKYQVIIIKGIDKNHLQVDVVKVILSLDAG